MATNSCEKVWMDKSSYDKAECLYQERLGKDVDEVTSSVGTNSTKKNKKISNKQNNSTGINNDINGTEITKNNKKKNKKKELLKTNESLINNTGIKNENSEIACVKETTPTATTTTNKKLKAKEAKEEKNKADKKQKITGDDRSINIDPKNEDQLISQGGQFPAGSLASEVARARAHIKQSLQCMDGIAALAGLTGLDSDFSSRVVTLEKQNQDLKSTIQELKSIVTKLDSRVKELESKCGSQAPQIAVCPAKPPQKVEKKEEKKDDDDEDIDLFGSDSEGEDEEAQKIREERLAAYAAKKSKKPTLIAKSSIILDIKPWDDETDMKLLETEVRKIEMDGLLWGASKLVPVAYNIKKLQINCVVEDDKVSIDHLTELIQDIEDYVQSVDIAAFNKI